MESGHEALAGKDRMELQATAAAFDLPEIAQDETVLIDLARTDPRAFENLYRRYYRLVASCIYRRTGDVHTTEDLAADTFIAAFRSITRYRHSDVPFRYWLLRIATNTVNRWARRNRTAPSLGLAKEPGGAGGTEADAELLTVCLSRLSPKHQAVLSLHYFESLSIEEVARVLGCGTGTVKSRLSRAREALRVLITQGAAR